MQSLRYKISKIIYVILLSISVIVDATLAISLYDYINEILGEGLARLVILVCAIILGACLYFLYMAQMEYLTKEKHK